MSIFFPLSGTLFSVEHSYLTRLRVFAKWSKENYHQISSKMRRRLPPMRKATSGCSYCLWIFLLKNCWLHDYLMQKTMVNKLHTTCIRSIRSIYPRYNLPPGNNLVSGIPYPLQKRPGTRDTLPLKRTWYQGYPPPPWKRPGTRDTYPPNRMTDTCENITFPQLRWLSLNMYAPFIDCEVNDIWKLSLAQTRFLRYDKNISPLL